jgi:hypothetical protein
MSVYCQFLHANQTFNKLLSSNNQLQRTGFTGPYVSERGSPAAELER